jgi:hypothetical protein
MLQNKKRRFFGRHLHKREKALLSDKKSEKMVMIRLENDTLPQGARAWSSRAIRQAQAGNQNGKIRPCSLWSRLSALLALGAVLILAFPTLLLAEVEGFPEPTPEGSLTLRVMPVYQFPSHVDGGGTLAVFSLYSYADFSKQINDKLGVGLSLNYHFDNYDFSGLTAFYVPRPWKEVQHAGFSVPIFYTIDDKWEFILIPQGQFSGEFGARFGDALVYGGGAAVRYTFGPNVILGVGVAGYYYLEQARVFPFFIVNLKLSDRITLSNPFRLSPAGPAGLIVSYQLNQQWEVGVGGAIRSYRFRLDYGGPLPNGIGEYSSFPLFARLAYKPTPDLTVGIYGGLSVYNRLRVENRRGDELYESGQDVAPLIGASISGRF